MSFDQIGGQESAIAILRNALRNGRLAHAYLFIGPEGVGKRLTALTLAKAMNCQSPPADGRFLREVPLLHQDQFLQSCRCDPAGARRGGHQDRPDPGIAETASFPAPGRGTPGLYPRLGGPA